MEKDTVVLYQSVGGLKGLYFCNKKDVVKIGERLNWSKCRILEEDEKVEVERFNEYGYNRKVYTMTPSEVACITGFYRITTEI